MASKLKVYISLPITGYDLTERRVTAAVSATYIRAQGHLPINPLEVSACQNLSCTVADGASPEGPGLHTWQCYMKYDIIALMQADAIYLLEGWEKSRGATLELHIAASVGMAVYFQGDKFPQIGE